MRTIVTIVLGALVTTAGVLYAQDVKTDRDKRVDFSKYHTFMWIKEPKTEDPLMKQRIINAVNAQLIASGLRLVQDRADLAVSANTATREEHTLESFYDGFPGGWGWHRHWGEPVTTYIDSYEVGTLVVDLFDRETKQIVWWSSASATISAKPEKNAEHLNKAVEKMFKDFPSKETRKTD